MSLRGESRLQRLLGEVLQLLLVEVFGGVLSGLVALAASG